MDQVTKDRREALLKEYGEVSSNFRLLTDIRFKLLAFLPVASATAVAVTVFTSPQLSLTGLISLFGLVVTISVAVYNERNNQLYNELVGRAAAIERSLDLPDGAFANRPRPWLTIKLLGVRCKVDHGTGVGTIYAATIALWLFGLYYSASAGIGLRILAMPESVNRWIKLTALALAIFTTYLAVKFIAQQKQNRQSMLRDLAASAVDDLLFLNLGRATEDSRFLEKCAVLAGTDTETVRARARFYANLDRASLRQYMPLAPEQIAFSHFVGLVTDLPPLWIFDCATNRRGTVKRRK